MERRNVGESVFWNGAFSDTVFGFYCEEGALDPEAGKWFCANEIKIFEFLSIVERNARAMGRAWLRAKGLRLPVINTKQSCTGRPSRTKKLTCKFQL
ncbi:hypothetical protein SLE2022_370900 [Rubroshorea leprosula]